MTDTDPSEFQLYNSDLTTRVSILPAADQTIYLELNEPGSGSLKVPSLSDVGYLITSGQFTHAQYRGALRAGFFVENINKGLAGSGEGGELWTSISGRGALALLDDAIVWNDGTPATTRDFNGTKAAILINLIDEAQARGALSSLTYDFTSTTDSFGNTWTDNEEMQFSVGKSYLDVVREIAEMGIDFNVTIETDGTFTLSAYRDGRGSDKSSTVYFRRGVNCVDVSSTEAGNEIKNALSVKYKDGYTYVKNNASITARRRREFLLDAIDAQNSGNANTYGNAKIDFYKDPKSEVYVKLYDGQGPRVFLDYDLGDWITLDSSGVEVSYRIKSIRLDWRNSEYAEVTVGLNSSIIENDIKQSNDIRKLFEQWRRSNDGQQVTMPFWAAIGKLSSLATVGTAVYAMAVSAAGKLYVGGDFTKIGNTSVGNAAVYDINTGGWSALGSGFNFPVYAIACNGTDIYFGGDFTDADGTAVNYVCKYDEGGGTFSDMDTGVNNTVRAITIDSTNSLVYVGGGFSTVGLSATASTGIAVWNESTDTWAAMNGLSNGTAFLITVRCIALSGTQVFVGAENLEIPSDSVAYWDTGTADWHAMGTGIFTAQAYAMAVIGDNLYIGGTFTDAGGVTGANNIVVWDIVGETFSAIDGAGVGASVYSLTVNNGVDLIVGGAFTTVGADATAANYIALWNAGAWTNLGEGLDGACYALTTYRGNIGAGGVFTHAGGKPIKYVGAYITSLENLVQYLETGGGADTSGYTHPNHTGDVTSVGDGATTIALNAVTNAKLDNMAEGTVKARLSTGTGDPEDVTLSALSTALGISTPTYTADRVLISGTGTATTDSNLTYDATNDRLELGVGVPANSNGGFGQAYEGVSVGHYLTTWGSTFASFVRGIFARGTKASPTAAQADDVEFRVRASAHDGSTYPASNMEIRFLANENQSNTAHGSRIEFYTTPNSSTTLTKAATITNDGDIDLAAGTYNIAGVPHTHTSIPNFQRNLTADLSLADGEAVVTAGYINAGAYNITLAGDSDLVVIQGNDSIDRAGSTTSTATPSINVDLYDSYELTAQAVNITSVTVTGSPTRNQLL